MRGRGIAMISLLVPYFLTFIGIIISGVHDFPAMAIFLTAIGVLWTFIGGKMKGYDGKGILIAEAIHAVIWIVCKFFPMFGAKLLGGAIGLAISIVILAVVVSFFWGGSEGGEIHGQTSAGTGEYPNVIYDEYNRAWQKMHDNGRGEASFQSDSGESVYFYPSNRYGNSAAAGGKKFHW